jgi:hypothetical protein
MTVGCHGLLDRVGRDEIRFFHQGNTKHRRTEHDMAKYFTIQQESLPDMTLPYPFFVRENGLVDRQDFWRGKVYRVIGFQKSLDKMTVDLFWSDAIKNPELATGMYVVTSDDKNKWGVYRSPIGSIDVKELDERYVVTGDVTGSGPTLEDAKKDFKRFGGKLSDGYRIEYFLGNFEPEVKVVKARTRS